MASQRDEVITGNNAPQAAADNYEGGTREASVADLQRRLQEKREAIGQKVSEIKTTMTTEYANTKHKVEETFDWKVQMQRYPLAACLGALAIGFLTGRALGHHALGPTNLGSGSPRMRSTQFGAGTSLAPVAATASLPDDNGGSRVSGLVQSAVHSKLVGRVEDVLSEVAEHFLSEVSRVGRELVVPTVVGSLTSAFQNTTAGRSKSGSATGSASGLGVSSGAVQPS